MSSQTAKAYFLARHCLHRMFFPALSVFPAFLLVLSAAVCVQALTKPISQWAVCDGVTDDHDAVVTALAAAKHNAFILEVDCPVFIHVGSDTSKPVFIDSGITVSFGRYGKFIVDNDGIPEFVIANSSNITFNNLTVEYSGGIDVAGTGGRPGHFNDIIMKAWMQANRGVVYSSTNPYWTGPTNNAAVFYLKGSTSNLTVNGATFSVPANATPDKFIPVVFSSNPGEWSGRTIAASTGTGLSSADYAIPSYLTFTNITFDGTYMGWVGGMRNAVFSHIRSYRYSDLQNADGSSPGGLNNWFAPPHLFYLSYGTANDTVLFNTNIRLTDIIDYGERIGSGVRSGSSGNCFSLKLGGVDSMRVTGYTVYRPDGFMDVLPSTDMIIRNVVVRYNSGLITSPGPWPAIRWPSSGYHDITFDNLVIADTAASTAQPPIGPEHDAAATNITISNTTVHVNTWTGTAPPGYNPASAQFFGTGNHVAINSVCASGCAAPGDAATPSTPTGLTGAAISSSQINLNWTASTDNVGVVGYNIFRDGMKLASTTTAAYSDYMLSANTSYTYKVAAYDLAGNSSAQSTGATAKTKTDTTTVVPCGATTNVGFATRPAAAHAAEGKSVSLNLTRLGTAASIQPFVLNTSATDFTLTISDIIGRVLYRSGERQIDRNSATTTLSWNCRMVNGTSIKRGIYFIQCKSGNNSETQKLTILAIQK